MDETSREQRRTARPTNTGDLTRPAERQDRSYRSNESEIRSYFSRQRDEMDVVATTETPLGQVLDWVPVESQLPPGERIAEPPSDRHVIQEAASERASQLVTFELEREGAQIGPEGTVPVLRKDIDNIDFRQTVDDIIGKYPEKSRQYLIDGKLSPPPPTADGPHRYASTAQQIISFGGEGFLSANYPWLENSDDFSLMQIACTNNDLGYLQSVEAGWQIRKDSYGDWAPHLFTYFTTCGYTRHGDYIGGYNRDVKGWVQYDNQVYPGALSSPTSVPGGAQYDMHIKYQWYNDNWWLRCNGRWLGYYPKSLFMGTASVFSTLGDHANHIHFYGEIYDSNVWAGRTKTDMGSGYWAGSGWPWAAYQRNLRVQIDRGGNLADYDGGSGWASDPDMYDIDGHMRSGGSWGSYMWLGGPGAG